MLLHLKAHAGVRCWLIGVQSQHSFDKKPLITSQVLSSKKVKTVAKPITVEEEGKSRADSKEQEVAFSKNIRQR